MKLQPYLNFAGNAKEAFDFYSKVFGVEIKAAISFADMPMEGVTVPAEEQHKMMHIAIQLGDDHLMASDVLDAFDQKLVVGNHNYVSVHPDSREEADRIFSGLSEGAEIEMPMGDQVWGDYFGSLKDKYGVGWMINYSSQQDS